MRSTCFALIAVSLAQSAAAAEPITIVTLGDSITKAVRPGVTNEQTFSFVLQGLLKTNGIDAKVINVGIGSEDTDLALNRFEKDVLARKPRLVTIMYGANDHWIHKPKGKTEPTVPPAKFEANLKKMVADLRKSGAEAVLMTTPPPIGTSSYPKGEDGFDRLEEYVKITRAVAKETKTPLVDHYADWKKKEASGVKLNRWITDAWHPNADGHQAMGELILPVVREALKGK